MIPSEIWIPIREFFARNAWIIIIIIVLLCVACASMASFSNDQVEVRGKKAIEVETVYRVDLMP